MSELKLFGKDIAQYLSGRVAVMALGFLSFPVLTRVLSLEQYGELSLLLKIALVWTVISKCGMQNAVQRFTPAPGKENTAAATSAFTTFILTVLVVSVVFVSLGYVGIRLTQPHLSQTIRILLPVTAALVITRAVQPILSGFLRVERRPMLYNLCEVVGKMLGIMLGVGAAVLTTSLLFYLSGLAIAETLVAIALLVWFWRSGRIQLSAWNSQLAVTALRFAFPLIAYELASVILDSGDRLLIVRILGAAPLAYYSAAYSLATYAEETLMMPINLAMMPIYVQLWERSGFEATRDFLSRSLRLYLVAVGGLALCAFLGSHDLICTLASKRYASASTLFPVLICGLLVYAIHIFLNAALILYKRTVTLTVITIASAVLNLGLNIYLLPKIGLMGAALATLLSYVFLVAVLAIVSRPLMPLQVSWQGVLVPLFSAGVAWIVGKHIVLSIPILELFVRCSVAVVIYAIGIMLFHGDCKQILRSRFASSRPQVETRELVAERLGD